MFVHAETMRLGRFLGDNDRTLVGWSRTYVCGCGFRCRDAGAIFDHAQECKEDSGDGQDQLFHGGA